MSIKKPQGDYEKTFSFHFFRWLNGEKDPYLDNVEMKPQEKHVEKEEEIIGRMVERQQLRDKIYDMNRNREISIFKKLYVFLAIVFCALIIASMIRMVSYLPPIGAAANPANNEVSKRYIEQGIEETGAINFVAGMILDYRAFDTFGESCVLFIATCTVLILLKLDHTKFGEGITIEEAEEKDSIYEPKNDMILQAVARILVPLIAMFGFYVMLNGHLSPGGGFSGGAIVGAGMILYLNAFGFEKMQRFFTEKTYKIICLCSLSFYCIAKSYSFFTGANHLRNLIPKGTPGAILSSGLILPLNVAVGLVVACTMYTFYVMFRKGGY